VEKENNLGENTKDPRESEKHEEQETNNANRLREIKELDLKKAKRILENQNILKDRKD